MQPIKIEMRHATEYEVYRKFLDHGVEVEQSRLQELLHLLQLIGDKQDSVDYTVEMPIPPRGAFALLVPKTYYNVNVKRASAVIAAAILDSVLTAGLLSAGLSISGFATRAVAKLSARSGEYCCLVNSIKLKNTDGHISEKAVHLAISEKLCQLPTIGCCHMREGICALTSVELNSLFGRLIEKGALEFKDDEYVVPA